MGKFAIIGIFSAMNQSGAVEASDEMKKLISDLVDPFTDNQQKKETLMKYIKEHEKDKVKFVLSPSYVATLLGSESEEESEMIQQLIIPGLDLSFLLNITKQQESAYKMKFGIKGSVVGKESDPAIVDLSLNMSVKNISQGLKGFLTSYIIPNDVVWSVLRPHLKVDGRVGTSETQLLVQKLLADATSEERVSTFDELITAWEAELKKEVEKTEKRNLKMNLRVWTNTNGINLMLSYETEKR